MFIGCDVKQLTMKHSTLGTTTVYPKGGENAQVEFGGLVTESDPKGITGSSEAIYKQSVQRWVIEMPPIAWKRTGIDTLQQVQDISSSFEEIDVTLELADGSTYIAKGKIVGELKGATLDATIPLKLEGGGILAKI